MRRCPARRAKRGRSSCAETTWWSSRESPTPRGYEEAPSRRAAHELRERADRRRRGGPHRRGDPPGPDRRARGGDLRGLPRKDLLLVGVLKGAVFFIADLMRSIDIPCEVDFMAISSYGSATDSSGVVRILKDLDLSVEGRNVLVVEDIIDSGLTLSYLLRALKARSPASLEMCALLTKPARRRDRGALQVCRLRDPAPVRDRVRPRLRRALPKPALRRASSATSWPRRRRSRRLTKTSSSAAREPNRRLLPLIPGLRSSRESFLP